MLTMIKLFLSLFVLNCLVYANSLYNNLPNTDATRVLSIDSREVTVEFNLLSLVSENSGSGSIVRTPDEGLYAIPGFPDIPAVRRMVQVPDKGSIRYEILDIESSVIDFQSELVPFQPLQIRGEPRQQFRINEEFYSGSSAWPESPIVIESVEILRDIRIARVAFLPVSWNPSSGEMKITTSVTVRFYVEENSGENELQRNSNGVTRSFVPFYEDVIGFSNNRNAVNGCYLVISTADGIDTISDLLDWKNRKGFEVVTGIIPDIGTTAAEIDAYIEDAFNNWAVPPEYILLVGDADMVPSPQYNGHSADNIYGVIGSGCVPSIHVGRLSGETSLDLQYEAWKIVQHEMYPFESGDSWFQKGISLGHTEFTANSWDYMEYMMAAGMDPTWYCENGGITPTVENLSEAINEGISILGHCGHGDVTTIYPPSFGVDDIAALENGRKLPWFALVACQVGMFEGNYCFCEALMGEGSIGDARGAIGAMGPTTNSPYGAADSLVKWIFKGYFQEDVRHMGAVTDWSKNEVFSYYGSSAVDNNHMHMLFGCPEMDIYYDTAPLTIITAVHADPIVPGTSTFSVTADGMPLEDALVAVKIYDEASGSWMDSDYSDASGNVTFTIPNFGSSSNIYVTATGFNMSPYLYQAGTAVDEQEEIFINHIADLRIGASPCSGALTVFCTIPIGDSAKLDFFDVTGRIVKTIPLNTEEGSEIQAVWSGRNSNGNIVPSGVYYCRLTTESNSCMKSVLMLN